MKKFLVIVTLCLISSCPMAWGGKKNPKTPPAAPPSIHLALTSMPQANKYVDLNCGIRMNIRDERANKKIVQIYDAGTTSAPDPQLTPSVVAFIPESMRRYMRTMGFNLDADVATDYLLQISIQEFHVDYLAGTGWCGTVILSISVSDHNRTLVYPNVEISGRSNIYGNAANFQIASSAINQAYANALADIDWDRIAFFLHKAKKESTQAEDGVPLDQITVHFNIDSKPRGADIYWRVISQTPEVKNQPYKYLQTTDYESTESLNIKGLTRANAGNVQIEIKVEKDNFYPKSTKLNVLSLIDDNDVSKMFKLVPMEE